MYSISNKKFVCIVWVSLFISALLFRGLVIYSGNYHSFYLNIYEAILDSELYKFDYFLKNSLILSSSVLYGALKYLGVNLSTDWVGLPVFIFQSSLSFYFLYRIFRLILPNTDYRLLLIGLIPQISNDARFLQTVPGSAFFFHTSTPSSFAYMLAYPMVFYALKNQWIVASSLLALALAFTVKATWFLYPVFFFYILINTSIQKKNLVWLLIPTIWLIYKSVAGELPVYTHETLVELSRKIISYSGDENDFEYQSKTSLIYFSLSLIFSTISLRWINNRNYRLLYATVICITLLMAIVNYSYTHFLYEKYPNPVLLLLSAVRATSVYAWSTVLTFSILILQSRLSNSFKILAIFLFGFFGLGRENQFFSLFICFLVFIDYAKLKFLDNYRNLPSREVFEIAIVCLIISFSLRAPIPLWISILISTLFLLSYNFFRNISELKDVFLPGLVFLLCLLSSNFAIFRYYHFENPRWMGLIALEKIGAYTAPAYPLETFQCLVKIREIHRDFVFINFISNDLQSNIGYDMKSNYIARKSLYIGNVNHFYLFPQGYLENESRLSSVALLSHFIKTGQRYSEWFSILKLPDETPVVLMYPNLFQNAKTEGFQYGCGSFVFLSNIPIPELKNATKKNMLGLR